jgi:predicted AAA+ superfamily ATPase
VISLTGPRQSGKTTLVRAVFPDAHYISLEDPGMRRFALEDARGFLRQFGSDQVILDEAQRAPELFSYIQGIVDEQDIPGQFILTGSQNFLLLETISQSLSGRCAIHYLLPFSQSELRGTDLVKPEDMATWMQAQTYGPAPTPDKSLFETLWTGSYPRIHDKHVPPQAWLASYLQTYIERDVRSIVNVSNLEVFTRFVRLCAGRTGQILNLQSLGNDCGVDHKTIKRWLSILETSFIVKRLQPFHKNFNKRLIKSPKLYFLDSGLLCYLLQIQKPKELLTHAMRGAIFESWVVAELYKNYYHGGAHPNMYFYRDSNVNEIDLILDHGNQVVPIEIKSGETIHSDFFKGIDYWRKLVNQDNCPAALVYGGQTISQRNATSILPWNVL